MDNNSKKTAPPDDLPGDDIRKNISKHFKNKKKFVPRKKSKGFVLKTVLILFIAGTLIAGGFLLYNFIGDNITNNVSNGEDNLKVSTDEPDQEKAEAKIIDEAQASNDIYENQDEDNDGLNTVQEMGLGTKSKEKDTDVDGIPDGWEVVYDLDPLEYSDALSDEDEDNLTNIEEYKYKTDPQNSDTDNDGYEDGNEVSDGFNPKGRGKL